MGLLNEILKIFTILFLLFITAALGNEADLADILIKAEVEKRFIPVLSIQYPVMDVTMAYKV